MGPRNFVVTVKETGDGKPWLLVEPYENIGLEHGVNIVMHLSDGTDISEAERIAGFLNDHLEKFLIKRF